MKHNNVRFVDNATTSDFSPVGFVPTENPTNKKLSSILNILFQHFLVLLFP